MKKRFTNQEITVVRIDYSAHPLYQIAKAICDVFYTQTKNFGLCEEEVFYETIRVIDDIKEQGTGYTSNLRQIFSDYQREFRSFDTSVPPEEWELAIHLIMCCVIIVLGMSYDSHHKLMGGKILNEIKKNSPERWKELIIQCGNKCQQFEYVTRNWINSYMAIDNNEYISDEIDQMLNPANKKKGGKKKKEETDSFKSTTCVFSKVGGVVDGNITLMYQRLCNAKWIDGERTTPDDFLKLFSGKSNSCSIYLCKRVGMDKIYDLFKLLIDMGKIKTNNVPYTTIIKSHFYDSHGNPIRQDPKGSNTKSSKSIYKGCINDLETTLE